MKKTKKEDLFKFESVNLPRRGIVKIDMPIKIRQVFVYKKELWFLGEDGCLYTMQEAK